MQKNSKKILIFFISVMFLSSAVFLFLQKDQILEAKAGYLRMTETTDYFHVQSDVYGVRVYKDDTDYYVHFYDGNGVDVAWVNPVIRTSDGVTYYAQFDVSAREVSLVESNKTRIVLKITGKYNSAYNGSGRNASDGSSDVTYETYYYIYPEYFTYKFSINAHSGINLYDAGYSGSRIFNVGQGNHFFDSGETYYGTTTGESLASNYFAYSNTDYAAVLATSTPDWQAVKISDVHFGTTTLKVGFSTEVAGQGLNYFYDAGNLKGISETIFAVRPKINTTASDRLAWAQKMLAFGLAEFSIGASVNDLSNETYQSYTPDGSYHVLADNNKSEFTVHANATNTWAVLSATSTAGSQTLSVTSDQGLEDPNGATSSWAYLGNRLPYGSFDVTDPDVLFYWDMNSTTTGQAPNKGLGTIRIAGDIGNNSGVSGNSIGPATTWNWVGIDYENIDPDKGSFAFWYRNASSTDTSAHFLLYHGDTWTDANEFRIYYDPSTGWVDVRFHGVDAISNFNILNYVDVNNGEWYFWRVNYDSKNNLTELYINNKLLITSNTSFDQLELYEDVNMFASSGENRYFLMDELYISSDPDQPDAPSYYDVIKYTDISSGNLTGIPETGAGSMKWNHPIASPIWQTQREDPVFTVHDWSPKTRATTTGELVDHLLLDLPLDGEGSNANVGKVYDKVSGEWMGNIAWGGVSFEQGVQGNALRNNPGYQEETHVTVSSTGVDPKKGTIEFDYRYTGGAVYYDALFGIGASSAEFGFGRGSSAWCFSYNGEDTNCLSSSVVNNGEWHHFRITWDQPNGFYSLLFDNDFISTSTSISEALLNTDLFIGDRSFNSGGRPMHGQIDNFRVYNDVILPYGAYYTGEPNDGHLGSAHPDLLFFWDMESDTAFVPGSTSTKTVTYTVAPAGISTTSALVGSKGFDVGSSGDDSYASVSVSDGDIFNSTKGTIGFWFNHQEFNNWTRLQFAYYDADNYLSFESAGNDGDYQARLNLSGTDYNTPYVALGSQIGVWNYVEITWDLDEDYVRLRINNDNMVENTSVTGDWDSDPTLVMFGATWNVIDAYIDNLFITNSPDTPMIPTAFGKPLIAPQLAINENGKNNLKVIETEYDIAPLNDITSWLVAYNGTLTDDTTFLITETLNSAQSSDAAVPLDRVHPLISTSYTSGYATITVQRGTGEYSDDFKLVFSEADAGVSSCFLGQGLAGSWGSDLCSATNLLTEESNDAAVTQENQTSVLSLIQNGGIETIIRNTFTMTIYSTTTEEWHIFSDGSIVKDIEFEKLDGTSAGIVVNSNFDNYAWYPAAPSNTRTAGVYHDSLFIHLTDINTDRQNDYLNPFQGATSSISGFNADLNTDIDADGYAESYGAYTVDANYVADPSVPQCSGVCGQPIYHTIGTTTATVSVTVSSVNTISSELFVIKFSGSPDLSGIHKRDKFTDSGTDNWNIISIDDTNDQIIVGDQEQNGGTPVVGAGTVGPWYASLYSWEAAEDRDLTSTSRYANGEIEMVECWPMTDTASVSIDGWTTDKDNFIKIYTLFSQRHKGVWDSDKYNMTITDSVALSVREKHVRIAGLQVLVYGGVQVSRGINMIVGGDAGKIIIENNIVRKIGTSSFNDAITDIYSTGSADVYIFNNIIHDWSSSANASVIKEGSLDFYVYNNTIYNCNQAGLYRAGSGRYVAKNNLIHSMSSNAYTGTFSAGSDNNSTNINDVLGVGENNRINQTFSFVSTTTKDFHLATDDTGAKGYGVVISPPLGEIVPTGQRGLFHDIEGQPRGNTWDIGADQIVEKYSNKFKVELDSSAQTLYSPRFLIQDFYPQVGKRGSEDDLITFHESMDDNSVIHQDRVSGTNVYVSGTSTIMQGYNGLGAYFDGNGGQFNISTSSSIINPMKGTINLWFTMDFDPNVETDMHYLMNFVDAGNSSGIYISWTPTNDRFHANFGKLGESTVYLQSADNSTDSMKQGEWYNLHLAWDMEKDFASFNIRGIDMGNALYKNLPFDYPEDMFATNIIGDVWFGNNDWKGMIDEVKIYSEPILPFGAYYTGYEQNGNYLNADPSLVFYWDAESDKALVGRHLLPKDVTVMGSQTSLSEDESIYGNRSLKFKGVGWAPTRWILDSDLDYSKGCYSYWFNASDTTDNPHLVGLWLDSSNQIRTVYYEGAGQLQVSYLGDGTFSYIGLGSIESDAWYHVKVCWDNEEEKFWAYKNGVRIDQTINTVWNIDDTPSIRIGSLDGSSNAYDVYIDQVFIVNNPYAEEIPTAFGRPLNMPLMKVDNTRQRLGYDYWASWTPDMSSVILQYFKNVNESTVFEVGASEGEAQIRRMKGGVRLEGGVRF